LKAQLTKLKTENTKAIVLSRINYGESDRIINVLTQTKGKLSLIVKGARKDKSKMAGGIELFSVIDISFISGRKDLSTLTSARLDEHYGNIIREIARVQLGYEILKTINKHTEDNVDSSFFDLLETSLKLLDNLSISNTSIDLWFKAQFLAGSGHSTNLLSDDRGERLVSNKKYSFDLEKMCFTSEGTSSYDQRHIKYMRLLFNPLRDMTLFKIQDAETISKKIMHLIEAMFVSYISL
jgi:DNA repair protein RecO (recombination protein O)